ncbi:HEAT repeat domain-containing protein [Cellulomonas sp. P22]|uniref:HEAT repeat domain-containing protein n=1 Tax=Cellulomonas sp. P22 TaxID=3373189 RepID=UPI0037A29A00
MGRREEYRAAVADLTGPELDEFLTARSGLPGPRGNLELAAAVADVVDDATVLRLAGSDDEYLRLCGVAALGRLAADAEGPELGAVVDRLRQEATDERWRVREAVAIALQRLGDSSPERLRDVVRAWASDGDPLVQRAALAAVCEPRLLRDPETAALALEACESATAFLRRVPPTARRNPSVRTLRLALGYCWSVAVAADPERGLPRFLALEGSSDPDVRWVDRENRRKQRLRALL